MSFESYSRLNIYLLTYLLNKETGNCFPPLSFYVIKKFIKFRQNNINIPFEKNASLLKDLQYFTKHIKDKSIQFRFTFLQDFHPAVWYYTSSLCCPSWLWYSQAGNFPRDLLLIISLGSSTICITSYDPGRWQ